MIVGKSGLGPNPRLTTCTLGAARPPELHRGQAPSRKTARAEVLLRALQLWFAHCNLGATNVTESPFRVGRGIFVSLAGAQKCAQQRVQIRLGGSRWVCRRAADRVVPNGRVCYARLSESATGAWSTELLGATGSSLKWATTMSSETFEGRGDAVLDRCSEGTEVVDEPEMYSRPSRLDGM